jgi:hypothetical protein
VRITRCRMFLLCGALFLFIGPAMVLGQPGGPPGGGGRGDRGSRGGRRGFDPNMIFNLLSNGKDYIVVSEMLANPMVSARDPGAKERVESFMQRHGITNGQLTREQFAEYMQERMTERKAAREAANPGGAAPGAAPSDGAAGSDPLVEPPPPEEEKRPVVYRAGKLPKELPQWFAQMDEDKDGQVGLYEWKKAGRPLSEFQAMDLNGDGFITVEEALRYAKAESKNGKDVASNGPGRGFGGGPSFGGPPGGGAPSFGGPPGKGGPPDGQSGQGNNFRRRRREQQQ